MSAARNLAGAAIGVAAALLSSCESRSAADGCLERWAGSGVNVQVSGNRCLVEVPTRPGWWVDDWRVIVDARLPGAGS